MPAKRMPVLSGRPFDHSRAAAAWPR